MTTNQNQAIKAMEEATNHHGPSIIIAYSPCIAHGIIKGMSSSIEEEKNATESGYFPLFRYNPDTKEFKMDSKADFSRYYEFISGEDRYRTLKQINPDNYHELLEGNKLNSEERYQSLEDINKNNN